MRVLLILIICLFSFSILAQTKEELRETLDAMKASGMMDEATYQNSITELQNMDEAKFNELKSIGQAMANDPKIQEEVNKVQASRDEVLGQE